MVTIFDVGEDKGIPYIAMEYLQGSSLEQKLAEKGVITIDEALRIGRETALGLAAAAELGLIHRDIKPANLWLESPHNRVKILDFGLARHEKEDVHLTTAGMVVGTPAYMSPEQARNDPLDQRTDLFSLGTVLYQLTTSQFPFRGQSSMAILTALAVDRPIPVRQLNPRVPKPFAHLIHRLLAKKPADRIQSAREVVAVLDRLTQEHTAPVPIHVRAMRCPDDTQNVPQNIDHEEESRLAATALPRQTRRWPRWWLLGSLWRSQPLFV